jgi:hypothetical protein
MPFHFSSKTLSSSLTHIMSKATARSAPRRISKLGNREACSSSALSTNGKLRECPSSALSANAEVAVNSCLSFARERRGFRFDVLNYVKRKSRHWYTATANRSKGYSLQTSVPFCVLPSSSSSQSVKLENSDWLSNSPLYHSIISSKWYW